MTRLNDHEAIIARVGQGDRKAFAELYSATSAKTFGLLVRILGDRSEAEDSLQETYVRVWRGAARFSLSDLSGMAWILTIARNVGVEKVRTRRREDPKASVPQPTGPDLSALSGRDLRSIEACLAKLDDNRARAIRGAYLDGLTHEQLALRFDVPPNTMRVWLRHSLMMLRECLMR